MLGTLGGGCLEAEIRRRARQALLSGQPSTFDLTLDHDYGWDDGLICGGTVFGLILLRAAEAADIWSALAGRDQVRSFGACAMILPSLGRTRAAKPAGFTAKRFRPRWRCGSPVRGTSRKPSRRWRRRWISMSPFSMTGRNWPTRNIFPPGSICGSAIGANFLKLPCPHSRLWA